MTDDIGKAQRPEFAGRNCESCGRLHGSFVPGKGYITLAYQKIGGVEIAVCGPCAWKELQAHPVYPKPRKRKKTEEQKRQLDLFKGRKKKA